MSYEVDIQRNADGVIRRYHDTFQEWDDEDGRTLFWWTDGNAACDCERGRCFAVAGGEPDPHQPCGSDAYRVFRAILPDGREIRVDDEPEPTNNGAGA